MMARRLPLVVAALAALAALAVLGPVAIAVALLRSSSDARGPTLAAQILIAVPVVAAALLAGAAAWALTRLILRLLGRA
jgi:hypothetical protein